MEPKEKAQLMTYLNEARDNLYIIKQEVAILTTQRDCYKKELEDQNEINVKLGKALDSSQEEVKRLKEENREIRDQILRKRDFYRTRQLNPEKYTYLALGLDDAFKIIQAVTKIKAFHSKE